jgi:hypothetical protein
VSKGAKQYHQKQQEHKCGVSKGAKQDSQKQQKHTCGVSKGAKKIYSHHMYVIVVFGVLV